ncbi:X-ray repair cross-complementing protein 5 [Geodia barretti]|uniref:X-ray repair cross-complementing protein 5 n=1 Tax=Geodia barretti TaxID=519541 RepID=A0AA35SM34_GEOBA|nr:X-ray repair cross-complementing protein 5 [Geodia barretti]
MKKTAQQLAGEAVLSRLVAEVDGASFSFQEASQVANFIRKTGKRQTTRFAGHLELGSSLKIACKIFTKVMHERPATWKKLSAVSEAARCQGQQAAVQIQRSYYLNNENETQVEHDNIVKGYRYGKSLVPITDEDESQMKASSERCLSLLGFSPETCVSTHQTLGSSVQVVVPTPDDQNAGAAMSALIHALYETKNVGVARYIARKNAAPRLVALLPQIKASHECLLMLHLPFMEDIRQYTFPSLSGPSGSATPSAEQLAAVDSLISSMDLMSADRDEDGERCEALKPKLTMNPLTQRVFQCISQRALNPDSTLPDMDPGLHHVLEPGQALLSLCSSALAGIKEAFPLMRVEKKDNKGTAVWKESSDLDVEGQGPSVKKPRVEEETDFSMASLARGEVTEVGTLDPVADFCRIVTRNDYDFNHCCRQLQGTMMKLVKESFGDSQYRKAMDCLRCLRRECLQVSY